MTVTEFTNWALSQGQVAKTDGTFPGQCVSLINQYLSQVYGIQAGSWGNAIDYASDSNPIRAYFDKVSDVQDDDILVFNYGQYGHIAIAISGNQILEQNGAKSLHVGVRKRPNDYVAILRRKQAQPINQGVSEMPVNSDDVNALYVTHLGRPCWDYTKNTWIDPSAASWVGKSWSDAFYQIKDSDEGKAYTQNLIKQAAEVTTLAQEVSDLTAQNQALKNQPVSPVNPTEQHISDTVDQNNTLLNQIWAKITSIFK